MTEEIRRKGNEVYTVCVCVCADLLESIYETYRGQTIEISVPQDISVSRPHYAILLLLSRENRNRCAEGQRKSAREEVPLASRSRGRRQHKPRAVDASFGGKNWAHFCREPQAGFPRLSDFITDCWQPACCWRKQPTTTTRRVPSPRSTGVAEEGRAGDVGREGELSSSPWFGANDDDEAQWNVKSNSSDLFTHRGTRKSVKNSF